MFKIEIPLKSFFAKISTSFDKPKAILLNLLSLLLKCMVYFSAKLSQESRCHCLPHIVFLLDIIYHYATNDHPLQYPKHVISMSEYIIMLL